MFEQSCICSDLLISVSDRLIKNMTALCDKYDNEYQSRLHYKLWSTQATVLAKYEDIYGRVQLAPHRLLPISDREDPLELFALLTQDCGLQPSKVMLNTELLARISR